MMPTSKPVPSPTSKATPTFTSIATATPIPNTTPPPSYAAWSPVFAAIITGVFSAWLTQALTLKYGLKRFVKEKDLTRRLEWHEKAYRAITDRQAIIGSAIYAIEEASVTGIRESELMGAQNLQALTNLLEESEMFASNKSYLVCKRLLVSIEENDEVFRKYLYGKGEPTEPGKSAFAGLRFKAVEKYNEESKLLTLAKTALADDIRAELGLDNLHRD